MNFRILSYSFNLHVYYVYNLLNEIENNNFLFPRTGNLTHASVKFYRGRQ